MRYARAPIPVKHPKAVAIAPLNDQTKMISPARNTPSETCMRAGRRPMMSGTCQRSSPINRKCRTRDRSRGVPDGKIMYSLIHCFVRTAISVVVRLKTRLVNHKPLIQRSNDLAVNEAEGSGFFGSLSAGVP